MESRYHFSPDQKMASLIADDYRLIQVMTRFGIRVGFGDMTVAQVCETQGVDCDTFLTVVNFVVDGYTHADAAGTISVGALVQYLKQSHTYFLDYLLPAIRRKLLDGIKIDTGEVSFLILKFFDEYVAQVRTHMEYEDRTVFRYVESLIENQGKRDFDILTYSDNHEEVSSRLHELKSIIIKYGPANADANLLNAVLYDIYRCEEELESHCLVEDELLMPAIVTLERGMAEKGGSI